MNKKILAILTLLILVAGMSAVSAFDFSDISNAIFGGSNEDPGNVVNIGGIDFNIPDGFKEDTVSFENNVEDSSPYLKLNLSSKTFFNDTDSISIGVSSSTIPAKDVAELASLLGGNTTTIKGIAGYEYDDGDSYGFCYDKDNKLVILLVPDKEVASDIIKV